MPEFLNGNIARMFIDGARSQLLVASSPLDDPNFDRSVVYVIDHNDEGAIGVVINRPLADPDLEPISRWCESLTEPPVVFNGGPVDPSALIALGVTHDTVDTEIEGLFRWLIECGRSTSPVILRSSPSLCRHPNFSADTQAGLLVNSTQKSVPGLDRRGRRNQRCLRESTLRPLASGPRSSTTTDQVACKRAERCQPELTVTITLTT